MHPLDLAHFDLVTPDGVITKLVPISKTKLQATVFIEDISPKFVGFKIDRQQIFFNLKSTLAQVGINGIDKDLELNSKMLTAQVQVELQAIGPVGTKLLSLIQEGATIGKLFAADDRRKVRDPFYLFCMFGGSGRGGRSLLSLGGLHGSDDLILDKVDGRAVAYLSLQKGRVVYEESIWGFLPTLAKALISDLPMREVLKLHQKWKPHQPHNIDKDEILLVKTLPLHIRTVYGRVVNTLLSEGYQHTTASVLQPDTQASGDIYELFGESKRELNDIPIEFYTLEPYREYVFFEDRDQLQEAIDDKEALFQAFKTAPQPIDERASVLIVKGEQLRNLKPKHWAVSEPKFHDFPGPTHNERKALLVERYIEQQPSYSYLKGIDDGIITSQGILLTRYFPSPLMKRMLLSNQVQRTLKGLYFQFPSHSQNSFFSAEDRALLHDLYKFAIPTFWVDTISKRVLKYIEKPDRDTGLFIPIEKIDIFLNSTLFGIYGSNLVEGIFEKEVKTLLKGILNLRKSVNHPLLNQKSEVAMVTGGGPGAMEVGNRVATELGILSCANIVDFRHPSQEFVPEQKQNPYIEAKMTYRLDKLVERQAEFGLDFPIFLTGGIGTDFEFSLEEVRRKVGACKSTPILLFGTKEYWQEKITSRYQSNLRHGTIKGSEWISNCFYAVQTAKQALEVYESYFTNRLLIGKKGPQYEMGFVDWKASTLRPIQK